MTTKQKISDMLELVSNQNYEEADSVINEVLTTKVAIRLEDIKVDVAQQCMVQLDELSPNTLGSYIKKASLDSVNKMGDAISTKNPSQAEKALPFALKVPNATTIAAMQEARKISQARFKSADELMMTNGTENLKEMYLYFNESSLME